MALTNTVKVCATRSKISNSSAIRKYKPAYSIDRSPDENDWLDIVNKFVTDNPTLASEARQARTAQGGTSS